MYWRLLLNYLLVWSILLFHWNYCPLSREHVIRKHRLAHEQFACSETKTNVSLMWGDCEVFVTNGTSKVSWTEIKFSGKDYSARRQLAMVRFVFTCFIQFCSQSLSEVSLHKEVLCSNVLFCVPVKPSLRD